jgi:formate hydrogenlyase subunit 6/NADH:ubiquinone oxidoreductase subunit I
MTKKPHLDEMLKKAASQMVGKPVTSSYPFVKLELPESFRGQPFFNVELCVGCGLCSRECPLKAIEMVSIGDKKRPQLKLDKCIFCSHCVEICPKHAIKNSDNFELASTDKSTLTIKPKLTGNI